MSGRVVCAFVRENEQNDASNTANRIQCGDTVYCASLPAYDIDHFRFHVAARDSIRKALALIRDV